MDKQSALLHAARGASGDQSSLLAAIRAALLGDGLATYAGNPSGNVTPANRGEFCLDTTSLEFYRANNTTNTSWLPMTGTATYRSELFDDFLGDVIADQWDTKTGTGTNSGVAVAVGLNGLIRITTSDGSIGTSLAIAGTQLQSSLNWQANQGGLSMEVRFRPFSTPANFACFIGFTDQTASLEMPITINDGLGTLSSTADDAIGFIWNPGATTSVSTWAYGGVKGTTKTAGAFLTTGPVVATFETFRIDVSSAGAARFFRNNVFIAEVAAAVTVTVPLTPVITMRARLSSAGNTQNLDVDYIRVTQIR